jgi:hypothetical protein
MKSLLTLIGLLMLAAGVLFMGQGSGYIPWPAESFMISQTRWVYYGGVIAIVGLVLVILGRR